MLETMIKSVIKKTLKNEYPYIHLPVAVYAKITKVQDMGTYYEYSLKILDENKALDTSFPEIPKVKSRLGFENGTIVITLLLYGRLNPYIVGEVI